MDKVLIVDGDKCTGCRVCELACSMAKAGEYNPSNSRIKILRNMEFDVSIPVLSGDCDFCGECIGWCFEGAITFVPYEEAALIRKKGRIGCFPSPLMGSGLKF